MSHVRHNRRKHVFDSFQGELRKMKPSNFDGDDKKGEEDEI